MVTDMTSTPDTDILLLRTFAHALRVTLPGRNGSRAHAQFVADLWLDIAPDWPSVNGAWFVAEATPRWVVGTSKEAAWQRAAASVEDVAMTDAAKNGRLG